MVDRGAHFNHQPIGSSLADRIANLKYQFFDFRFIDLIDPAHQHIFRKIFRKPFLGDAIVPEIVPAFFLCFQPLAQNKI